VRIQIAVALQAAYTSKQVITAEQNTLSPRNDAFSENNQEATHPQQTPGGRATNTNRQHTRTTGPKPAVTAARRNKAVQHQSTTYHCMPYHIRTQCNERTRSPARKKRYSAKFRQKRARTKQLQHQQDWYKLGIISETWTTATLNTTLPREHQDPNDNGNDCASSATSEWDSSLGPSEVGSPTCSTSSSMSNFGAIVHREQETAKQHRRDMYWNSVWKTKVQTNFTDETLGRKAILRETLQACEYLQGVADHLQQLATK